MMKTYQAILIIAAVIAVLSAVGSTDYNEEVAQQTHYEKMVCSKAWPNYKKLEVSCDE